MNPITLALPKGRLYEQSIQFLSKRGITLAMKEREFISEHAERGLRAIMVRNTDLPRYVHNGIAGMGIVGTDVLSEYEYSFFELAVLPFGGAKICLAGTSPVPISEPRLKIATKYPRFTHHVFHARGIPVEVIPLHGSVELAPLLGLAPYIVDLVETGDTLKAHNLSVIEELATTKVVCIVNKSFYKVRYREVDTLIEAMCADD